MKAKKPQRRQTYFLILKGTRIFATFDETLPRFSSWMAFMCWWAETTEGRIRQRPDRKKAASAFWYQLPAQESAIIEVYSNDQHLIKTITFEASRDGVDLTEIDERTGDETHTLFLESEL